MIFLSVVPFQLLGETGAAMKIAAVAYSSLVLGSLYTLGRTVFGRACGTLQNGAYLFGSTTDLDAYEWKRCALCCLALTAAAQLCQQELLGSNS